MARKLLDTAMVQLTCKWTAPTILEIFHGEHPLRLDGNNLFNELRTVSHAELALLDFDHDGVTYHVYVWETCDDGSHVAWQRDEHGARSGPRDTMAATLLVCTTPAGEPPPEPANGPPAPGAGQSLITVKFRKRGSKPF